MTKVADEKYKLEQTGQESEVKGQKAISQAHKEQLLEEAKLRAKRLEVLYARKHRNDYNNILVTILKEYLQDEELEKNVKYTIGNDGKGIIMYLGLKGRIFQRAFKPCREPLYDLNACEMFAISASSLVTKLKDGGKIPGNS